MLNLYPRQQLQARNAAVGGGDKGVDELDGGYNPFYGIAVVCLSIFLFCVLAASVTIWKALAVAALAALLRLCISSMAEALCSSSFSGVAFL